MFKVFAVATALSLAPIAAASAGVKVQLNVGGPTMHHSDHHRHYHAMHHRRVCGWVSHRYHHRWVKRLECHWR